jgi:two-component system sensor histidine kinase FlrB
LAAALLYAGALGNPALAEKDRARCGTRLLERLRHLERLIRDRLTYARGEVTGGESVPMAALVAELVQVFEPLARERGTRLAVSDESGGATVSGNRKALVGALTNLLENALDACAGAADAACGGCVELRAEAGDGAAHFVVRDNGRGMDAATKARLFEPFFTTRAEGTGLGLAIARGVARAHGGSIEVESAPDAGSLFRMSLPVCVTPGSLTATSPRARVLRAPSGSVSARGSRVRRDRLSLS